MFLYRICPTNVRPLPFTVTEKEFTEEWKACWEDKHRNMNTLMDMMQPAIKHWKQLLTRQIEPDVLMVSLCASLGTDPEEALDIIDKWIERSLHSVEETLWTVFLEQVRGLRYYPTFANPAMAEFVLVQDFKRRLSYKITHSKQRKLDYVPLTSDMLTGIDTIRIPDYYFIKHLKLDKWEAYLLWWLQNRKHFKDGARLSRTPFISYKLEERKIWRLLRENY